MENVSNSNLSKIKDKAVFATWVSGLLILISVLWILTQPLQSRYLMRSVNNVLNYNDDTRRLAAPIHQKTDKVNMIGYWYSMNNTDDKMFVFAIFQDGILLPLGAVVSANGKVNEIMPLSTHSSYIFDSLPESILKMYSNRIESAVNYNSEGDK